MRWAATLLLRLAGVKAAEHEAFHLPSKLFYSDEAMPESRVAELAAALAARMEACGHPFIMGTECDTLHVEGASGAIRAKVFRMLEREPPGR